MLRLYEWLIDNQRLRGYVAGHPNFFDGEYIQTTKVNSINDKGEYFEAVTSSNTTYRLYKQDCNDTWVHINLTRSNKYENIPIDSIQSLIDLVRLRSSKVQSKVRNSLREGWLYVAIVGSTPLYAMYKTSKNVILKIPINIQDLLSNNMLAKIQDKEKTIVEVEYTISTPEIRNIIMRHIEGIMFDNIGISASNINCGEVYAVKPGVSLELSKENIKH